MRTLAKSDLRHSWWNAKENCRSRRQMIASCRQLKKRHFRFYSLKWQKETFLARRAVVDEWFQGRQGSGHLRRLEYGRYNYWSQGTWPYLKISKFLNWCATTKLLLVESLMNSSHALALHAMQFRMNPRYDRLHFDFKQFNAFWAFSPASPPPAIAPS